METSQLTSPLDEGWKINGAGKRYNRKFGFGRLDVSKMVNKALKWKNVDKQKVCHGAAHTTSRFVKKLFNGSIGLKRLEPIVPPENPSRHSTCVFTTNYILPRG